MVNEAGEESRDIMERRLDCLTRDARLLSARRRQLQRRIDFLRDSPFRSLRDLQRLDRKERAASAERRALHRQIDELRDTLGLPRWESRTLLDRVPSGLSIGPPPSDSQCVALALATDRGDLY